MIKTVFNFRPKSASDRFSKVYENMLKTSCGISEQSIFPFYLEYKESHITQRILIRIIEEWRKTAVITFLSLFLRTFRRPSTFTHT